MGMEPAREGQAHGTERKGGPGPAQDGEWSPLGPRPLPGVPRLRRRRLSPACHGAPAAVRQGQAGRRQGQARVPGVGGGPTLLKETKETYGPSALWTLIQTNRI